MTFGSGNYKMKLLFVDKYHYTKGGSETAFFSQMKLMKKMGHEVFPFSMRHERNMPSVYSRHFVKNIDYSNMNTRKKIINGFKIIYSLEAKKRIGEVINDVRPDIAHLHIFQHQLSPSIIWELKKNGIPIVHTVHDLKIVCPNYLMMTQGNICERCIGGSYYNCILRKCSKGSLPNSIVLAIEAYLHRLAGTYSHVDAYICPSRFYMKMLEKGGVDREKLFHIPNFIDPRDFEPKYRSDEDYMVYFGRLSAEKGILTLIDAVSYTKSMKLLIVGCGPIEDTIKEKIRALGLENLVFMLGYKSGSELHEIIRKSRFVVLPSEWYENAPYSVLEAMALGKPVIGSDIGGIPELVLNGKNGYLFKRGDALSLAIQIERLSVDERKIEDMGRESRKLIEEKYTGEFYYEKVLKIYNRIMKTHNERGTHSKRIEIKT
jgi:glycosyltransferase involved in cell wall biosynthesis